MNALEGVTLVDFGQYLAGPFGPMVIGDLGANVIKVEPITGDGMRAVNKPFFGCQRGKRDIALDLKTERGHEVALRLIERADIVHHNMTAGVAKKLRIAYDDCKAVNEDVVYCNTWAYGLEGPLARFGGLDPLFQAAAGIEYDAGPVQEGNPPLYLRFGMTDTANAMLSVVGCLAALYHQRKTGEGQELWTSLLDGAAVLEADAMLVDGAAGRTPAPRQGPARHRRLLPALPDVRRRLHPDRRGEAGALGRALRGPRSPRARRRPALRDRRRSTHEPRRARGAPRAGVRGRGPGSRGQRRFADVGVPSQVPTDTHDGELMLFDADNERLGLVAEYEHPLMGHDAPVRHADRLLGDARPHRRATTDGRPAHA